MNAVILHTRFWHDDYICQLGIKEKLLFLYFISNEHVNTAGVYELPEIYIRTATRLQPGELKRIKTNLSKLVNSGLWIVGCGLSTMINTRILARVKPKKKVEDA